MRLHQRGSLKSVKICLKLSNPTKYNIGDHAMLIGSHFHGMLKFPKFVSHPFFLPFTVNFVVQPKNVDFRPNTIFRVKFLLNFFQSDKKFVTCCDNTIQNKSSLENFTVISAIFKNFNRPVFRDHVLQPAKSHSLGILIRINKIIHRDKAYIFEPNNFQDSSHFYLQDYFPFLYNLNKNRITQNI